MKEKRGLASRNPNGSITCAVTVCVECGEEVLAFPGDDIEHCSEHSE